MPKKRAHANSRSHDNDLVGASKAMPASDLPTLRDVLAYVLLLKVSNLLFNIEILGYLKKNFISTIFHHRFLITFLLKA